MPEITPVFMLLLIYQFRFIVAATLVLSCKLVLALFVELFIERSHRKNIRMIIAFKYLAAFGK